MNLNVLALALAAKAFETTGSGDCASKTVHKEDITGSQTIRKTHCD